MSTILGSYNLNVPAAAQWIAGPLTKKGELVRIRASGVVRWFGAAGAAGPSYAYSWGDVVKIQDGDVQWETANGGYSTGLVFIPASKAADTITSTAGNLVPTGTAIPSGATIVGVKLTISTTVGGGSGVSLAIKLTIGGVTVTSQTIAPSGPGSISNVVGGPTELFGRTWTTSDLASLDWSLKATNTDSNTQHSLGVGAVVVTFYTAGSADTYRYALPEGTYPTAYPSAHALDPGSVLAASAWTGSALVATGRPPLSLAMLVLPDGQTPALSATSGCLSPQRDTTYDAFTALGATDPDRAYRLWFVVNDGTSDFTDDTGGYAVQIDRISNTTMPEPLSSLVSPRFGLQSSLGTQVPVSRMFGCIADKGLKIKPDQQWEDRGIAGFGYKTGSDLTYDVSSGDVTLNLDTLDTGYVLYSVFGGETVTTLATGVYQHVFEFNPFKQAVAPAYSLELPTEPTEIAQATLDLIFNGLKVTADPSKRPTSSTAFLAGKLAIDASLSPGQNSVQVLTINGGPTGGTFYLLDGNKPSGQINYSSTLAASAVQSALQQLPSYASATVGGSAGGPFTITNPTGAYQRPLNAAYTTFSGSNTFVGGTDPSATISITNPGGMKINDTAPCLAQSWIVSVAPTWAQLENAPVQLTDNWSSEVTIGERYDRKWVQGVPGAFRYVQKDGSAITDSLSLEMAFVAQVRQFINASRSGQRMAARLRSTGAAIGATGFNRSLTIDMDGQAKWNDNSDSDNVRSIKIDFEALYNLASGTMLRVTIVNELSSYANL